MSRTLAACAALLIWLLPCFARASGHTITVVDKAGVEVPFCLQVVVNKQARWFASKGVQDVRLCDRRYTWPDALALKGAAPEWLITLRHRGETIRLTRGQGATIQSSDDGGIDLTLPGNINPREAVISVARHPGLNVDLSEVERTNYHFSDLPIVVERRIHQQSVKVLPAADAHIDWTSVDVRLENDDVRMDVYNVVPVPGSYLVTFDIHIDRDAFSEFGNPAQLVLSSRGLADLRFQISAADIVGPKRLEKRELGAMLPVLRDIELELPEPTGRVPREVDVCVRYPRDPPDIEGYVDECGAEGLYYCEFDEIEWGTSNRIICPIAGLTEVRELIIRDSSGLGYAGNIQCELEGDRCVVQKFFGEQNGDGATVRLTGGQINDFDGFVGLVVNQETAPRRSELLTYEQFIEAEPPEVDASYAIWLRHQDELEDLLGGYLDEIITPVDGNDLVENLIDDDIAEISSRLATQIVQRHLAGEADTETISTEGLDAKMWALVELRRTQRSPVAILSGVEEEIQAQIAALRVELDRRASERRWVQMTDELRRADAGLHDEAVSGTGHPRSVVKSRWDSVFHDAIETDAEVEEGGPGDADVSTSRSGEASPLMLRCRAADGRVRTVVEGNGRARWEPTTLYDCVVPRGFGPATFEISNARGTRRPMIAEGGPADWSPVRHRTVLTRLEVSQGVGLGSGWSANDRVELTASGFASFRLDLLTTARRRSLLFASFGAGWDPPVPQGPGDRSPVVLSPRIGVGFRKRLVRRISVDGELVYRPGFSVSQGRIDSRWLLGSTTAGVAVDLYSTRLAEERVWLIARVHADLGYHAHALVTQIGPSFGVAMSF